MRKIQDRLLKDERRVLDITPAGRLRIGIGYPNTNAVGMSSLAFQRAVEIAASADDKGAERLFAEPDTHNGRSLEIGSPLGAFDVLAWSCSFELDAVNLVATLDPAGIPRRRNHRGPRHVLLVMGRGVASIKPLPLAAAIDVIFFGSAELPWPPLAPHEATRVTISSRELPKDHRTAGARPLALELRAPEPRDRLPPARRC